MRKRKKKLEDKIEYEFYRWGTLSPKDHPEASLPGDSENRTYHTAPVRKGIYAFPKGYIEPFLLGMSDNRKNPDQNNNGRCFWLRGNDRKILTIEDIYSDPEMHENIKPEIKGFMAKRGIKEKEIDYIFIGDVDSEQDWNNKENYKMIYMTKVKRFKYSGPYIWHHLKYYGRINDKKLLVDPKDIIAEKGSWIKTTMKVWLRALERCDIQERWESYICIISGTYKKGTNHGNPHTYPKRISKDHYEVFIEKI